MYTNRHFFNRYVYCRKCDVSSLDSVREFVRDFRAKEPRLDGLVNNAGVMKTPRSFTPDGIETQWATNHLGPFLLTHLLRDSLVAAAPSRVIYVANLDYRKGEIDFDNLNMSEGGYDRAAAFNRSQLANMVTMGHLAEAWAGEGVAVNAVYPGVCGTNIKRHMGVDRSFLGWYISNPLLWFFTKTAKQGAQTVLYALIDEDMCGVTGKLLSNLKPIEVDEKANDVPLRTKLMAVDKYWSGLVKSKDELVTEK